VETAAAAAEQLREKCADDGGVGGLAVSWVWGPYKAGCAATIINPQSQLTHGRRKTDMCVCRGAAKATAALCVLHSHHH
jgi:hypothetical protein